MSATEVTDYFLEERKIVDSEVENRKSLQKLYIFWCLFLFSGATLFSRCGANFSTVLFQFWNCRSNDKSIMINMIRSI